MGSRSSNSMSSCLTASRPSLLHLSGAAATSGGNLESLGDDRCQTTTSLLAAETDAATAPDDSGTSDCSSDHKATAASVGSGGMVSPENPPSTPERVPAPLPAAGADAPKATTFEQLRQRYLKELEYMLTEFRKLERQLLGAKAATRETDGSRERREKLHSFIMHLDDTIQQIRAGCREDAASGDAPGDGGERPDEETIRRLEEHILADLLPVKVRLKKQLAAQHGAKHNPATMPTRGTLNTSAAGAAAGADDKDGKASFVPVKKLTESQFGKPLGGGSSLTQKLHGSTLGSSKSIARPSSNKIQFAGLAIGSDQIESSVHAATSVHTFVVHDPALLELQRATKPEEFFPDSTLDLVASDKPPVVPEMPKPANEALEQLRLRLLRKKRKRRKQKQRELLQKQKIQAEPVAKKRKQAASSCPKKRGPRAVEYICALCNEVYQSSCEYNTWWALSQQECPKCRKGQIPRIDISAPSNAIEYHPALLAHAEEAGGTVEPSPVESMQVTASSKPDEVASDDSDSLGSELTDEDWDGLNSDDDLMGSDTSDDEPLIGMTPPELAERERFGAEYTGPTCGDTEASRLLVLMGHAATCPCQHKSPKHRDVCRSAKYMMLHVRDCPGTTSLFDVCPFPWCRKVKHLLYHLVTCQEQEYCSICSPTDLTPSFLALNGLNEHRFKKLCEALPPKMKLSADIGAKACHKDSKLPNSPADESMPSLYHSQSHPSANEFFAQLESTEGQASANDTLKSGSSATSVNPAKSSEDDPAEKTHTAPVMSQQGDTVKAVTDTDTDSAPSSLNEPDAQAGRGRRRASTRLSRTELSDVINPASSSSAPTTKILLEKKDGKGNPGSDEIKT